MPRISADAVATRDVLVRLDWQMRHVYFNRYVRWASRNRRAAFVREVRSLMSPDELLLGLGGCKMVEPFAIIPLPAPDPRYRQLKLSYFNIICIKKVQPAPIMRFPEARRRYYQMKLSFFGIKAVRRRSSLQLTIKECFKKKP